ncbi:uncharacterized protein A1O5_05009 [Cladophialophora psammophila CBS 110553]|uniref:aldehyde dehydrogenase (NAD(+)) n=1 Tax=Cladophialophora psammophila CBS 110553 TaxID=1182543 RepID=W9XQ95_9EURO|nr:uncharacterized protein A1O5_05009 [Cladophialophora psammophila CBS 110553]EXJ72504.1 hypothetical protein A1O5_05009 [Cladophialophora psammophila CBS 110553]
MKKQQIQYYRDIKVYVHEAIVDEFVKVMKEEITKTGPSGDTLNKDTIRGPQADRLQFDRVLGFLTEAHQDRLFIMLGGNCENQPGFYFKPTIITDAHENHQVMREELFGPVVVINTFTGEEEVMELANDTKYGTYASVFTNDIQCAMRIAKLFNASIVGVNCNLA